MKKKIKRTHCIFGQKKGKRGRQYEYNKRRIEKIG